MNILVTAGNTQVPIDRVRAITNIFTGRTGTSIALHAHAQGHVVTLLTSHLEIVEHIRPAAQALESNWQALAYRTFADLQELLEMHIRTNTYDAVIHCAAVSDYQAAGIFAAAAGTAFDPGTRTWRGSAAQPPELADMSAGKVKSSEPELWLRLTRTPKLIDFLRSPWGFRGILVKFKLEVGLDEAALLKIAETSRQHSQADLMVANTLEGAQAWALLGPLAGGYQRITRTELPAQLLEAIKICQQERTRG